MKNDFEVCENLPPWTDIDNYDKRLYQTLSYSNKTFSSYCSFKKCYFENNGFKVF